MNVAVWVAVVGGLFSVFVVLLGRWYEVRSVNVALLSEVQRLLSVLNSHKTWWESRMAAKDTNYPLLPFTTPMFDAQATNVGRIDKDIVGAIVKFYGYVKFLNALQAKRRKYIDSSKSDDFDTQYLSVLGKALQDHQTAFEKAFRACGLASG